MPRRNSPVYLTLLLALTSMLAGCGQPDKSAPMTFVTAPLIDPNTASETELQSIPGLTDAAVSAILAGRPYATPSALHAVVGDGLSDDARQAIYSVLFVKVGLNTGAEEDYKLIPSTMSPGKLAHEFEEYRPYESVDQFRQEMAKYVSGEEVAHLSRYVTLD